MAESLKIEGKYKDTITLKDADGIADHFVSDVGNGKVYDPYDGKTKNVEINKLQKGRETRLLDYY